MALSRRAWEIVAPGVGRIVNESIAMPGPGDVVVQAEWGAVSPGSEMLAFSGGIPDELALDDTQSSLAGRAAYPLRYGYILVGRVAFCGDGVDTDLWLGRRVFAFHPHASHAVVPARALLPIPEGIHPEEATLYANTETAVSLHWDGAILPGETVVVTGLGIVGLLVTAIALNCGAGVRCGGRSRSGSTALGRGVLRPDSRGRSSGGNCADRRSLDRGGPGGRRGGGNGVPGLLRGV
jgi:threonine dehydrogenase-like Zn-dependent dehydrogenase